MAARPSALWGTGGVLSGEGGGGALGRGPRERGQLAEGSGGEGLAQGPSPETGGGGGGRRLSASEWPCAHLLGVTKDGQGCEVSGGPGQGWPQGPEPPVRPLSRDKSGTFASVSLSETQGGSTPVCGQCLAMACVGSSTQAAQGWPVWPPVASECLGSFCLFSKNI